MRELLIAFACIGILMCVCDLSQRLSDINSSLKDIESEIRTYRNQQFKPGE